MAKDCERCKKAYEHLGLMFQGAGPNDRIGAQALVWADPIGAQWSEIKKKVDKDIIKSVWQGVSDDNISKGRLKISQCIN